MTHTHHSGYTLRGLRALDADGGFTEPVDVRVEEGLITAIGPGLGTAVLPDVDASGLWLLPGIVDSHAHLGCFTDDDRAMAGMDVTRWTLEVARNAAALLRLGVTTVRDVATGTPGIRDAIADGCVPGPRLLVSGPAISQTGGHADGFVPSLGAEAVGGFLVPAYPGRPPYLADGAEEMRKVVRMHLRGGVDWIKLCTTGGLLSSGLDHPLKPELTDHEIGVAVSEAARAGVPVAAHAYGGPGLDAAIDGGVRSVEHGLHLTEAQAARMAAAGTTLVPTLSVYAELDAMARAGQTSASVARRVAEITPFAGEAVAIAREAGVRIALGTDLVRQGANLGEITLMHRAGLPVEEALLAATAAGADLCGLSDRGRIAIGQVFDAILLDDDPSDASVFLRPGVATGVFQAGRPVVAHPCLAAAGVTA